MVDDDDDSNCAAELFNADDNTASDGNTTYSSPDLTAVGGNEKFEMNIVRNSPSQQVSLLGLAVLGDAKITKYLTSVY